MQEISINGNAHLQSTHFFVYKGKNFPFNMKLFKCFSQYFQINKNQYKSTTHINILDDSEDEIDLTEGVINDFINFCQAKNVTLNKENSPFLHRLAKKYSVPVLIDSTKEFIQIHQKEVVVDLLILNLKDQHFDTTEYEKNISDDLLYYINDSKLLSLPIPVLYRILTKYQQKNFETKNNEQITEFLFKCLDKYEREASILFEQIDLTNSKSKVLNRLLYQYSDKFDFHFINSQLLKTIYERESEIIERTEKTVKEHLDYKKEIESLIQKIHEKDDQIQQKNEEIERMILKQIENEKTINSLIRQHEEKIQQIQSDFKKQVDSLTNTVDQLTKKVTQQSSIIDQFNTKIKEEDKPKPISKRFSSESDPKGIISLLGDSVTLECGLNDDPSHPIENIKNFNSSSFINKNYGKPENESDTHIIFDFGTSKKIDLYSYFIHSVGYHPKTWRIEGSNDKSQWKRLDRQANNRCLNDGNHRYHFECNETKHENDCRYRYIRYVQEDSWQSGDPYRVYLYYFELYGEIYSN